MLIYLVRISHVHFSLLWYAFLIYSPRLHLIWWKLFFSGDDEPLHCEGGARRACFFFLCTCVHAICVFACVCLLPSLPFYVSLLSPLRTWQRSVMSAVLFTLECSIVWEMIGLRYSESGDESLLTLLISLIGLRWLSQPRSPPRTSYSCIAHHPQPSKPHQPTTPSQLKEAGGERDVLHVKGDGGKE